MGKTCFFIGHRDTPDTIFPQLVDEVERHISAHGVDTFVVGHYGRFVPMAEPYPEYGYIIDYESTRPRSGTVEYYFAYDETSIYIALKEIGRASCRERV